MLGKLVNKFKKQSLQDLTAANEVQGQAQDGNGQEVNGANRESVPPMAPNVEQQVQARAATLGTSPPNEKTVNGYQLRKSARLNVVQPAPQPEPPKVFPHGQNHYGHQSSGATMIFVHDSGTESDEELEHIDSMSNASSAMNGASQPNSATIDGRHNSSASDFFDLHSPPALTSSPPLLSEFDTNSWDSMGCESGIDINLRESSERDDISQNIDLLELEAATPVDKSHAFPVNFDGSAQIWDENSPSGTPLTAVGSLNRPPIDFSGLIQTDPNVKRCSITPEKIIDGPTAFQPVRRRLRSSTVQENNEVVTPPVSSPSPTGNASIIGEKRRWETSSENSTVGDGGNNGGHISPIASRTRSMINANTPINAQNDNPRPVLTAKRTRVHVLIHNPTPGHGVLTRNSAQRRTIATNNNIHQQLSSFEAIGLSESPPTNPIQKRGRHSSITGASSNLTSSSQAINVPPVNASRPCLDFDKMRLRMMINSNEHSGGDKDLTSGSPRRKPQLRSASNSQSSLEASACLD